MFDPTEPPFQADDNDANDEYVEYGEYVDEYDGGVVVSDPVLEAAAAAVLDDFDEALEAARLVDLDADATLVEAEATKFAQRRVQARQVWLAAHWADLHAVLEHPGRSRVGGERLISLGGDGTVQVGEFAPAEFGALLEITDTAAHGLIGDALDLRHRFPRLWAQVHGAGVDVWVARKIAQQTRTLSKQAAARVDAQIAGLPGTITWPRLRRIVAAAVLAADPPKALSEAERAGSEAGARVEDHVDHGYATIIIKATAGDIAELAHALDLIADALRTLGDTSSLDRRRATAAGIIAHPKTALDLLTRADALRQTRAQTAANAAARRQDDSDADADAAGQTDTTHPDDTTTTKSGSESSESKPTGTQPTETEPTGTEPSGSEPPGTEASGSASSGLGLSRRLVWKRAVLYYHLSKETLDAILAGKQYAGAGVVRVEDIGPIIADQVCQWLAHTNVVVKPVIDLSAVPPVDHYDITPSRSEAIGLIRAADSFPHGTCTSRHQDNDHTQPYIPMDQGGPPGQTDPLKMAKLTRTHHRLKTHGGWTVHQVKPGAWQWRSPHGYHFLVDQHGTTPLGKLE